MGFTGVRGGLCAVLIAFALPATSATAQQACPNGQITFIFIDNHSIFDPDDLREDQPFLWGYRLANAVHMRTRESFIRSELLFEVGDCYDEALLEESERTLRLHRFISQADIYGLAQPDSSWHVVVDTKDEWTTKINVRVAVEDGIELRGADLTEENILGRGILAGVFFREHEEQRDLGASFFTPRTLGTRLDLRLSAGNTRVGDFFEEGLTYPFVGEVGRVAARQVYLKREELFPYAVDVRNPDEGEITHVLLPVVEERFELTLAARVGTPGNLTTFGLGVSNATLDFGDYPNGVQIARDSDFGSREIAPAELAAELEPHTLHSSATRLNLLVGQRNIRFVRRQGLDALRGVQDIAVGSDLGLTLGRSAAALSRGEGQPVDLYVRGRAFFGGAWPTVVLNSALTLEGRQILRGGTSSDGWNNIIGELDFLLYWQPARMRRHTFFLRVDGAGGWRLDQPFQLTMGGGAGLRGYDDPHLPAGQRLIVNVEDRIYVGWPVPELFDLGLTVFGDVGRGRAGDVPFAVDSGWRGTAGAGLRVGFPAGTRGVLRVDAAFPLGPDTEAGDVIFRLGLREPLGLLMGFENRQLARSRRVNVGPDLFTDPRR
jgi:hypothetical protein